MPTKRQDNSAVLTGNPKEGRGEPFTGAEANPQERKANLNTDTSKLKGKREEVLKPFIMSSEELLFFRRKVEHSEPYLQSYKKYLDTCLSTKDKETWEVYFPRFKATVEKLRKAIQQIKLQV